MKIILPFIILTLVIITAGAGCITTPNIPPVFLQEELAQKTAESIFLTLKDTAAEAITAAEYSASHENEESAARQALASLYQRAPLTHDLLIADNSGIVIANYPTSIYLKKGTDLSSYPPNEETFKNIDVYISEYLEAQNGQNVYLMSVPIKINGKYSGYLSLSFDPYRLFGEMQEEISSYGYNLFVLQTDGVQVYDSDIWEAGRNILTDSEYADIHELMTEICENPQGNGFYSFYADGRTEFVEKAVYWDTVAFGEEEWRIAVTKELKN